MQYAPEVIEATVKDILVENLCLNPDEVVPEAASLREDLNADSLDLAGLVVALDHNFNINITDAEGDAMKTVADVVRVVEQKIAAA